MDVTAIPFNKLIGLAIYSTAAMAGDRERPLKDLDERGRGFATVTVDLFDGDGKPVMRSEFEWFVTKIK